jgi:hypothetical protein
MKKVILSMAVALACVTSANAQKQTGGEKNIEVAFAPLGGNPISMSGIRLRIFNSESSAIRLGVFIGGTSSEEIMQEANNDIDALELIDSESTFDFSLNAGYEMHFAGTDRLSPYVGGEIAFGSSSETTETQTQYLEDGDDQVQTQITKGGTSRFGVNLVAGVDYYIADALYLGAEIGFGFARSGDKENETTFENPQDGSENATSSLNNVKSASWGPNYQGTIRLGWLFN